MSDITHGGRITPQNLAGLFDQQAAALIKSRALMFRLLAEPDEYTRRVDRMLADDGGHRWFAYCLDAVARGGAVTAGGGHGKDDT